ncbi:MAG: PD-(D/E)XK nuclease family protein [Anaerolineaceae bacterium]|nr:PD-(D/E)XK nuclease family protein [Anaerolineaceae bacterium]
MPIHLLISPPGTGKTQTCLNLALLAIQNHPLSVVWYLVPDQIQADSVRMRFSTTGKTASVRVATFYELNIEILERLGCSLPVAGNSMLHRFLQEIIRSLCDAGQIPHYASISGLPGFLNEIRARLAELQLSLVAPQHITELAQKLFDPGLIDLARIYSEYHAQLLDLGWTDPEGLGKKVLEALKLEEKALTDIALLIVDGFANFNPAQLQVLELVANCAEQTWITLPGTPEMTRPAHRGFASTARNLIGKLSPEVLTGTIPPHLPATLIQVESQLFETSIQSFSPSSDLQRIEARSTVEEAREALRWLKGHVIRDNLQLASCAVAVPDLEMYRAAIQDAADEFGLPLQFSQGVLLSATPLGAAVTDLLNLSFRDYPLRLLLDTIRSPYFDLAGLGLHSSDAKVMEITSRYGQVVQGLTQWEETLQELATRNTDPVELDNHLGEGTSAPRLPTAGSATRLLDGLRQFSDRLIPPTGELSYKQWAIWLQGLLESLSFFDNLSSAGESESINTFDLLLSSLAQCEALTGACFTDYNGFLREWEGLLSATLVQDERSMGLVPSIRVMRLMDVRGIRMDALVVVGLSEGIFPTIERVDPFLSEDVRKQLGMEARLGQEQAGLFYQAITRADQYVLLTRPYLAKDGEIWEPSPYWNAMQELFLEKPIRIHPDEARSLCEAASANELLFWTARRWSLNGLGLPNQLAERWKARWQHIKNTQTMLADRLQKESRGPFDGDLSELNKELSKRYGERAGWSASRLESYASCPFSFLASTTLGLEVIEAPQVGYQANQLGTVLHEVLEKVYQEVDDPTDTISILAHLPEVARLVFEEAPKNYQFRPSPLWETQQAELLLILEATVKGIAEMDVDQNWKPLAFEAKFGMSGQPALILQTSGGDIRLHGLIDRIDINPQGDLRVIDYKSGGSHLSPIDFIEGRRLQLPIYALAASQALNLGKPVEGFYWKLFQRGASALKLSKFESDLGSGPEAAFAMAVDHIEKIVNHIRKGHFQPTPPPGGCPEYCAASAWCWHCKVVKY